MATLRTVIIDTDAVATSSNYYTGLAEAELAIRTANETDLVSRDEYIEFRCTGSAVDTDEVTFDSSSWVTSEDNYIAIIANDNHNGQWNENIYRLIPSTPPQFSSLRLDGVNFVRVIGLQIRGGHLNRSARGAVSIVSTRHGYAKIHRNYILADSASLSYASTGLDYYLGNAPGSQSIEITSNIFDGWINTLDTNGQGPSGSRGRGMWLRQYATRFVYNNTFINCATGSHVQEVASTTYFENNLAYGNNLDFVFGTLGGSNDYNASGDSTAIGSNSLTNISNPFVDYAGGDYSLRTQSPLLDAGNYQSASLEDVRGKTRVGTWDIGAFEKFLWTRMNLSPELVTNGGFDADSDWTKGGGWSIAGGVASANDTTNRDLKQDIGAIPGNTYRVTYTILNYVKGNISVNIAGNSGGQTSANGTYVKDIVAGSAPTALGVLIIRGGGDHQFDVDNVSVKEVKTIAKPSTELITNGGFDTDTDWTRESGAGSWTISNGVATANDTFSYLFQNISVKKNTTYQITFTIVDYVSGDIKVGFYGTPTILGTTHASVGTFVENLTTGAGPGSFALDPQNAFSGSIDNVSVKEVKALIK